MKTNDSSDCLPTAPSKRMFVGRRIGLFPTYPLLQSTFLKNLSSHPRQIFCPLLMLALNCPLPIRLLAHYLCPFRHQNRPRGGDKWLMLMTPMSLH